MSPNGPAASLRTQMGRLRRLGGAWLAAAALASAVACGSSGPSAATPAGGGCTTGPDTTTIIIANNAVCPQKITVARGSQVTFVNQDSVPHEMYSDPHPDHTDCPELNQVGHLEPGQSRQSGNLNIARACGFHDHINFQITALQGTITIQ
jgi:plastocyanin